MSARLRSAALAAIAIFGGALEPARSQSIESPQSPPADRAAMAASSVDEATILGPPAGRPLAGPELDAATRALAARMRCPVCQGMAIADSPSASAVAMVSQVRDLLARGYTEEQVLDYFVRSYGEFVLLEPTAVGFNLVVWLAPVVGVLIGAVLIALRLRASRRRRATGSGAEGVAAGQSDDESLDPYLERVRSEVRS